MPAANHHGTLVIAAESGVFITGPSGSGKTALALRLLVHCSAFGCFARLVGDDQVFLHPSANRLVGSAPAAIAGMAEARGFGPAPVAHEPRAIVDLVVRLVPARAAPRLQDEKRTTLSGVALPCLDLPARESEGAVLAIAAHLSLPPFA